MGIAGGSTADAAYARGRRVVQAVLLALLAVAMLPLAVDFGRTPRLGWFLFTHQDLALLVLPFAATVIPPGPAPAGARAIVRARWLLPLVAVALVAACRAGHDLIFLGRDFSRDEQMARFDAFSLLHGRLAWPVAPGWRACLPALNDDFVLPVAGNAAWASNYLPVNALAQGLLGAFASPLLVGIGAVALWDAGARLWPGDRAARAVALALYALSAQVVVTGMTAYAMSGHLALDLVWLALFLRGGRRGHGGAMLVGALATGLHQPLFHPLFVLPFLGLLALRREWRVLAAYLVAYAAIGGFWLAWPGWVSAGAGGVAAADAGFGARLAGLVARIHPLAAAWLMALNLLRFATWQHAGLLPLAALGIAAGWRAEPMVRALAIGIALPVLVSAVLLPYQGHGWGYRYLHGVVGNAALLGGYGWRSGRAGGLRLGRLLAWTSLASAALLPLRAAEVRRMTATYARAAAAIRATPARVVIVDDAAAPFAADLVVNRPDLAPPVLLRRSRLTPAGLAALCRRFPDTRAAGTVVLAPIRALYDERPVPGTPPSPACGG